jgi:hypothetical protein
LPHGENLGKFAGQTHFSCVNCKYQHCPVSMLVFEAF